MSSKPNQAENIKYLFEPRNVAVIGASTNPVKIGYRVVQNIVSQGYKGGVYPVNPKGGVVYHREAVKSIKDIDQPVDLACITVPAPFVFDSVKECADNGVKNVAIITSGFSEVGNTEEEHKIAEYAKKRGCRVLGPNIFGIYSRVSDMNATFASGNISPGNIAIITQSGAIGIAMIGKTAAENIGLSAIVSVGNKSDVDEADLIEYLIDDPHTKIILMYIEGVKDGVRFIDVLRKATAVKPCIVIKSGRSKRGAVAVASHTGSLAGSDEIFDAIMRQCGVLRANSISEAFKWGTFMVNSPEPKGDNCVIITNGGGIGVLATDACEKFDVTLYDDMEHLEKNFKDAAPEYGSFKNPVDITGGASEVVYDKALTAALKMDDIHSVLSLYCETATMAEDKLAAVLERKFKEYQSEKPIAFTLFGGEKLEHYSTELRKRGVPVIGDVDETVSALGALYFSHRYRKAHKRDLEGNCAEKLAEIEIDVETIEGVAKKAMQDGRSFLLAAEAQAVMGAAGIPIPQARIAKSMGQAVDAAEEIGYPVVLKIVSKDILHKSDAGGVALDLLNKEEVMDAYQAIIHNCRKYNENANIAGMEVSKMVEPGVETIIGARRDKVYGPIIMFGLGGIYVEVMKDVSFRSLPITTREAAEMIHEIRSYPLLLGVRGEKAKDIETVIQTVLKVGELIQRCPSITDIEINPLVAYERGEGCLALDARILISNPKE